jgi:FAD/FMN-containing dehydrogenase/Fe-S oxidoreductase
VCCDSGVSQDSALPLTSTKTAPLFPILQGATERRETHAAAHAEALFGPHPHEGFAQADELAALLRETVRGEVRFDAGSRALYATDASNYRQVPIGLVVPLDEEDVIATVAACRRFGAPVLSRGGGTSLAGQCCNVAVVLDFSKYMRAIVELDAEAGLARVQPGIVLDALRTEAEKHELTFAPDPATHSRCTLGGMIGNNSCGVHALMGGKTVDNIESLKILLYDGTRMRVGPTSEAELAAIIAAGGRRGEIYAGLQQLRDSYAELVRARFPDIPRRVSGYNLDQLLPENGFNVARALVGTEGTCVTVLEATCALKPSPQFRRLIVLGFADAFIAADHVPAVLAHGPIGLEGFDGLLVDFMHRKNLVVEDVQLLPAGRGFLLCEFGADSALDVDAVAQRFVASAESFAERPTVAVYSPAEAARVWKVREAALGASVFVPGEQSGWEGWEDSAVPPASLGAYLRELFALIARYGYRSPMYGHFGQGCVHLRISFQLKTAEGVAAYRRFIEEAADIVLRYGGSFSGEHGDGQARAALLPKMFGPELMQAFRAFKALWDPTNRMNPGKLIDPVAVYDPVENLRIGAGYQAAQVKTWFAYAGDGGSFADATTRCVGVGACRKEDHGTMCPSYMATREEKHSTRGRAHLLWEMMQGDVLRNTQSNAGGALWRNEAVKDALDLCLACKACKTECPVNVDMATWKAEFLAHYYAGQRHPLQHYAFGFMDRWARMASRAPRLANLPLRIPAVAGLAKKVLGVAPQRVLPAFAAASFQKAFHRRGRLARAGKPVLLWPDTWNNYFYPQALRSAAKVLQATGCAVEVPREHVCCGRPLYDFGFLDEARQYLLKILDRFEPQIRAGVPVVMLEPSCASVFRDELVNFFPNDERAVLLSRQTMLLSEMLAQSEPRWVPPQMDGRRIVVQGHCHQKAVLTMDDEQRLLRATGAEVEVLDSGCCGMAGPFGFEADKFVVSQRLAERVLLPAVRAAAPSDVLVANGFSCREQIGQNSTRRAVHMAEVMAGDCL